MSYRVSSRTIRATQRNPASNKQTKKPKQNKIKRKESRDDSNGKAKEDPWAAQVEAHLLSWSLMEATFQLGSSPKCGRELEEDGKGCVTVSCPKNSAQ